MFGGPYLSGAPAIFSRMTCQAGLPLAGNQATLPSFELCPFPSGLTTFPGACTNYLIGYVDHRPLTNLTVAEEALALSPADRAELAKLLIQSLEGDARTDDAIKADLANRLEQLRSGADPGLTFEEVFNSPL